MPAQDGHQYHAETVAVRLAYPGKLVQGLDPSGLVQAHQKGYWIGTPAALIDMIARLAVVAVVARTISLVLSLYRPECGRTDWSKT